MTPRISTGKSPLEKFGFRCSLTMWLKIISENYCKQLFTRKNIFFTTTPSENDRLFLNNDSLALDFSSINSTDVERLLEMMPNLRYRKLIELRYIKEKSNEETASILSMTMDNYYNIIISTS